MNNEPDILQSKNEAAAALKALKQDLVNLDDAEFESRHKATKKFYGALTTAIDALKKIHKELKNPDLETDPELLDNTEFLIADYMKLLDQKQMAAFWAEESNTVVD